jgi:pimeloyl-ACP methyl ester carboxylesterase
MNQAIVIIGGYNSLWPAYLKTARVLEDLSGLQAVGVPLMPWHWWAAGREEDATNILQKLAETVAWARNRFQAERLILVGHSAGGIIARLYLHDGPVWGRIYAGAEHVDTLITLGSPHCGGRQAETGWFVVDTANQLVPGTPYADRVRYRAVAGKYVQGHRPGSLKEMRAFRLYRIIGGQGDDWGDGVVPLHSALLGGAETLVLEGVAHSAKVDHDWFGSSEGIIRRWWPQRMQHAG